MYRAGTLTIVAALACSSSDPIVSPCAIAEVERLDIEIGGDACACDWEEDGFESESACRSEFAAYLASPIIEYHFACLCEGGTRVEPSGTRFDCLRDAVAESYRCLRRAGCEEAARDACLDAEDVAADACGALDSIEADLLLSVYDECMTREIVGPGGTCPDEVVEAVASSTTFRRGDDSQGSCGGDGADVAFEWVAPEAGMYRVTLVPADEIHEVVLYVLDECGGLELGCDAPIDSGLVATIELAATAGETFVLVADGDEADDAGEVELRIARIE